MADDERSFTACDGRVPDPYAFDVGDRILWPWCQISDPDPELTGAHAAALAAQGGDAVHLFLGELEVEDAEVLTEVLLTRRLGDG